MNFKIIIIDHILYIIRNTVLYLMYIISILKICQIYYFIIMNIIHIYKGKAYEIRYYYY